MKREEIEVGKYVLDGVDVVKVISILDVTETSSAITVACTEGFAKGGVYTVYLHHLSPLKPIDTSSLIQWLEAKKGILMTSAPAHLLNDCSASAYIQGAIKSTEEIIKKLKRGE